MKLSIIIPIYNVEAYISRCMDSIYSQGIDERIFEVIAINDGSSDGSSQVVREYSALHENITFIEQKNAGVSCARNNGIKKSQGDYLMFVDPDDALIDGCLPHILRVLEDSKSADMIICRSFEETKEFYRWKGIFDNNTNYSARQLLSHKYLRGSVCGALYNHNFIKNNGISFIEGMRNGEDTNFNMQVLFYSNKLIFRDVDVYKVIGRERSASRAFTKQRIDVMIQAVKSVYTQAKKMSQQKGNKVVLPYMTYSPISNLVSDSIKTEGIGYWYLNKHGMSSKYMVGDLSEVVSLKNKMLILKTSFSLFYFLNRIKG